MGRTRRTSWVSSSSCTRASASSTVFDAEILDQRPGLLIFEANGKDAAKLFAPEAGGHRWQRVPPTEKRGRRHTSTVTVAVLPAVPQQDWGFDEREIEWSAVIGSGPGGQAKQKTSNAVVMKHLPTGITVRVETSRSQWQNRQSALGLLAARIADEQHTRRVQADASKRRDQIGSGQRGDKIRTVRLQDDQVVDHRSGKRMKASRYLAGHIHEIQG